MIKIQVAMTPESMLFIHSSIHSVSISWALLSEGMGDAVMVETGETLWAWNITPLEEL